MAYAKRHAKEKQREADRRYRERHPERLRERDKRWREANPAKRKAQKKRHYQKHREQILKQKREYYERVKPYEKVIALVTASPEAYAAQRAKARVRSAKKRVCMGKVYSPRYYRRIPDWCVKGGEIDVRSAYIVENTTLSEQAYARELAIERKKRKWS